MSNRATRTKKRQRFNHCSHLSCVVGECSGTGESEMSLSGNDGTKQDKDAPTKGSGNNAPSSKGFTVNNASTTICTNSPHMKVIAKFPCSGTIIGKKRMSGLGSGKTERVARDARSVHPKTKCLVRVGAGRSDGGHNRTLPVRQSPKFALAESRRCWDHTKKKQTTQPLRSTDL